MMRDGAEGKNWDAWQALQTCMAPTPPIGDRPRDIRTRPSPSLTAVDDINIEGDKIEPFAY